MTTSLRLYIGNRRYSSWSLRPWILMRALDIPFECEVIPFEETMGTAAYGGTPRIKKVSPTGQVPVLYHEDLVIPDSLAIIEYLGDLYPQKPVWPDDLRERARARAIALQMHAGFAPLRSACGMNFGRPVKAMAVSDAVLADVRRIEAIFADALQRSGGPFLFGKTFGAADAMYAPVINRLHVYDLPRNETTQGYMDAVMSLPAWRQWHKAALKEPWRIPAYEDE